MQSQPVTKWINKQQLEVASTSSCYKNGASLSWNAYWKIRHLKPCVNILWIHKPSGAHTNYVALLMKQID